MPYNAAIPQATDQLSVSQGQLLDNFADIYSLVNINHVIFDLADAGKHKWITFPNQPGWPPMPPNPVFIAGEIVVYNFINPLTTINELYVQRGPANPGIPFTASAKSTNGWTYLPSGLLVKWGYNLSGASANPQTIVYPVAANIPVFSAVYNVMVTTAFTAPASDPNRFATLITNSLTTTTFQVWGVNRTSGSDRAVEIFYIAIGS